MSKQSRTKTLDHLQRTISGIKKYFPNAPTLTLKGKVVPTQDVLQQLQSGVDAVNAAISALSKMHDAVALEEAIAAQLRPVLRAIKTMVLNVLGDSAEVLSDFGIAASKPKKPTVAVKAEAADKARATRKAHGIQGKRQRKQKAAGPGPENGSPAPVKA